MSALVSIVICAYNRQTLLAAAIESVLAQTYPVFELLVWDDGSTDASLAVAQHYAQRDSRVRVVAAPHQGFTCSLKAAISETTAPYLGWVDSDDLLAPTALEKTVAVLDANPAVGMVYTDYLVIDEEGRNHGLGSRCRIPYSKDRLLIDFMTFHFRLIRRSVYEQVGGLDAAFVRAQDYDLCLRLAEVTKVEHINEPLYGYRQHSDNLTLQQEEQVRWAYKASTDALKRRGLSDRYEILLNEKNQFCLQRRVSQAQRLG